MSCAGVCAASTGGTDGGWPCSCFSVGYCHPVVAGREPQAPTPLPFTAARSEVVRARPRACCVPLPATPAVPGSTIGTCHALGVEASRAWPDASALCASGVPRAVRSRNPPLRALHWRRPETAPSLDPCAAPPAGLPPPLPTSSTPWLPFIVAPTVCTRVRVQPNGRAGRVHALPHADPGDAFPIFNRHDNCMYRFLRGHRSAARWRCSQARHIAVRGTSVLLASH